MDIESTIIYASQLALGWPLMIYITVASIICSIALKGIHIRYFFYALKLIIFPSPSKKSDHQEGLTPVQAFINTLSSNLGNGSIAGVATALYSGGPGAALWLVIFGFILMAVRFVEVYASTLFADKNSPYVLGGPVHYLKLVPGGSWLASLYVCLCLLFGLTGGNASQANSIRLSITTTFDVSHMIIAIALSLFVLYVVCGGAQRIIRVSDALVPVKVGIFCVSMIIMLSYHWAALPAAFSLIVNSAFCPGALYGGLFGFSIMQAIQYGMARSIFATESGLGTAAVLFGATHNSDPFNNGLLGMMSTFVSTLFCFIVMLGIIASGVWNSGLTSTALTIAALETVFGNCSGWIVSFLSLSFGLGVIIAYAYIVRVSWLYLTDGKYVHLGSFLYCLSTFVGALLAVDVVWALVDLVMAGMLLINLYGIIYLLPRMVRHINTLKK